MNLMEGLEERLGVERVETTADQVVMRFTIGAQHLQQYGLPHGGIYCVVHESAASLAGATWLGDQGMVVGTNNICDFLRQAEVGDTITVTATPVHRGRSQQLWHVDSVSQDGRLIAQGQVRLANLDRPRPS